MPKDLQMNDFETHTEILCKVIKKRKYQGTLCPDYLVLLDIHVF